MIGWLEGEVLERDPSAGLVVLNVGGVGYELRMSLQTLGHVPEPGERCALFVHTHVREDALVLYGFARRESRLMFRMLNAVPKVGPKNALATLGGLPLAELVSTIAGSQATRLTKIPGIGKRTAEQIVLTLKDKLVPLQIALGGDDAPSPTPLSADEHPRRAEAEQMLIALGWKAKPVQKALDASLTESDDKLELDAVVRSALKLLMEH